MLKSYEAIMAAIIVVSVHGHQILLPMATRFSAHALRQHINLHLQII